MSAYKMPNRIQDSNKGTFGKVLNFAGCKNYIGAAYLSSISPLKVGAGFVALSTEKEVVKSVSTLLPEAVYLTRKEGVNNIQDYSVVLLGCGLGLEKKSIDLVKKVFNKIENKPIVIDADALNIIAKNKLTVPKNSIITPHPLEAARLLCVDLDTVLNDLENSAKQLAKKYKCIVVLKNHRTIICDIDKYYVNQCGNSALAKAGTGDVLAGIIAGLIAQKMDLFEAAKLGVYLHARSGEIASEEYSEFSVLASELPFFVHKAIKELI